MRFYYFTLCQQIIIQTLPKLSVGIRRDYATLRTFRGAFAAVYAFRVIDCGKVVDDGYRADLALLHADTARDTAFCAKLAHFLTFLVIAARNVISRACRDPFYYLFRTHRNALAAGNALA